MLTSSPNATTCHSKLTIGPLVTNQKVGFCVTSQLISFLYAQDLFCFGIVMDQCTLTPCSNGTCETQDDGEAYCDCDGGYMGDICSGEHSCQIVFLPLLLLA